MADVYNSIPIGFPWEQDLTLPDGMLAAGDKLRADFRYTRNDASSIFTLTTENGGIVVNGNLVSLIATGAQTDLIQSPAPTIGYHLLNVDMTRTPLVGEEQYLGFYLLVPAEMVGIKSA